jgi:hypothetical protein
MHDNNNEEEEKKEEEDEEGREEEEEDRDGRNVRFGFPTDEHDANHLPLPPLLPNPSTAMEEEGREGGQVSWVRERYLRLFPQVQVPREGGSGTTSPMGLVMREGGREGGRDSNIEECLGSDLPLKAVCLLNQVMPLPPSLPPSLPRSCVGGGRPI